MKNLDYSESFTEIMREGMPMGVELRREQIRRWNMMEHKNLQGVTRYRVDMPTAFLTAMRMIVNAGDVPYTLDEEAIAEFLEHKNSAEDDAWYNATKVVFYNLPNHPYFTTFKNMINEEITQEEDNALYDTVFNRIKKIQNDLKAVNPGNELLHEGLDELYYKDEPVNPNPVLFTVKKFEDN